MYNYILYENTLGVIKARPSWKHHAVTSIFCMQLKDVISGRITLCMQPFTISANKQKQCIYVDKQLKPEQLKKNQLQYMIVANI